MPYILLDIVFDKNKKCFYGEKFIIIFIFA